MYKIHGKVVGNPATTPMRVPDWEQTDPKKSDYIKNKPDIDKIIKEAIDKSGGNGSGGTVQTDYLQNDATQPDFLKHRPFYKEKILLTEGQVVVNYEGDDEFRWVEGAYMPAGELPNIEVDGHVKLLVEVNDNGEVSTQTGYFDGWSILNGDAAFVEICDGKGSIGYLEGNNIFCECWEEIGDVTIKIFIENIKTMDKEYLPQDINTVPYIAGDGSFLGTPEPSDLPSGACILYGMLGKAVNIHYFEDNPTLCNVINDGEGTVKLYWFEEDTDYGTGIRARYMCIFGDDEILEDSTFSLEDLNARISSASDDAVSAIEVSDAALTVAIEAKEGVMSVAEEVGAAYSVAEEAYEAATDDYRLRDCILMQGLDGNVYRVTIDSNGNLIAEIFE